MVEDDFTCKWTYYTTLVLLIYSAFSGIVAVLVLIVMFREKAYSNNMFFAIYRVSSPLFIPVARDVMKINFMYIGITGHYYGRPYLTRVESYIRRIPRSRMDDLLVHIIRTIHSGKKLSSKSLHIFSFVSLHTFS